MSATSPAPFNTELLINARRRTRRSQEALARAVGCSVTRIRAIEGGRTPDNFTIAFLHEYARQLGLTFDELFTTPAARTSSTVNDHAEILPHLIDATDPVTVDALAIGLDWPPARVRLAIDDLATALGPLNTRIAWHGDVAVELVGNPTSPIVADSHRSRIAAEGLNRDEARALAQLLKKGTLTKCSPEIRSTLIAAGLIVEQTDASHRADTATRDGKRNASHHGIRERIGLSHLAKFNAMQLDVAPAEHASSFGSHVDGRWDCRAER